MSKTSKVDICWPNNGLLSSQPAPIHQNRGKHGIVSKPTTGSYWRLVDIVDLIDNWYFWHCWYLTNNWQLLAHIWLRCKKRAARDASSPLLGKFDAALFCVPTSCVQWQLYVAVHSVKWTLCSGSSSSSLHWQEVYHMQYAMCKLHLWLTSCEHVTGSSRTHFSCIQAPELLGPSPLRVPWICKPIPKSSCFLSLWHHSYKSS